MDNGVKVGVLTFIGALAVFVGGGIISAASPLMSFPGIIALVLGFASFAGVAAYLLVTDLGTKRRGLLGFLGIATGIALLLGAGWNMMSVKRERDLLALSKVHIRLQQVKTPDGSISTNLLLENKSNRAIYIPRYILRTSRGIYHEVTYRDVRPERFNILEGTTGTIPVGVFPPGTPLSEIVGEFELGVEGANVRRLARVTFQAEMAGGKYDPVSLRLFDEDMMPKLDLAKKFLAGTEGSLTIDLNHEDGPEWAVSAWNIRRAVSKKIRFAEIDKTAYFHIQYKEEGGDTITTDPAFTTTKEGYPHTVTLIWDDRSKRYGFTFDAISTPILDLGKLSRGIPVPGMQLEKEAQPPR